MKDKIIKQLQKQNKALMEALVIKELAIPIKYIVVTDEEYQKILKNAK